MGRRLFMCLSMLIHLQPFGPVAAGRGGHKQGGGGAGGNDAVRVVPRRAKWVLPRRGQVGSIFDMMGTVGVGLGC